MQLPKYAAVKTASELAKLSGREFTYAQHLIDVNRAGRVFLLCNQMDAITYSINPTQHIEVIDYHGNRFSLLPCMIKTMVTRHDTEYFT